MSAKSTAQHPASLGRLKSLGVSQPADLLLLLPAKYTDYRHIEPAVPRAEGQRCVLQLSVVDRSMVYEPRMRLTIYCEDAVGTPIDVTIWGNFRDWESVQSGTEIMVAGQTGFYRNSLQLQDPALVPPEEVGRLVARYRGKKGVVAAATVASKIRESFADQVDAAAHRIACTIGLPAEQLAQSIGYVSLQDWLRRVHFPQSVEEGERALAAAPRLATMEVIEKARRCALRPADPRSVIKVSHAQVRSLIERLPFPLTQDQARAISEVLEDLEADRPMRRLLSGDVGTGKTLVYLIAAFAAHRAGAQVAIMVPYTLLVDNTVVEARKIAPGVEIVAHVPGKPLPPAGIVVGTTSLISMVKKEGRVFDLVIVDEQHKLSAADRSAICRPHTNVLEASATAIPRTQALVSHAGMDVSILEQSPYEKHIETHIVERDGRERLFEYLKLIVRKGHQIAFIYPLVTEESEADKAIRKRQGKDSIAADTLKDIPATRQSIERASRTLMRIFPGQVGILYGGMPKEEKQAVIENMKAGRIQVLAASTAIELGITLPSLKAITLVNPDTLGLAALHQLRGRVARHGGKGMCFIYLPEPPPESTMMRYQAFAAESSGFRLAEIDLMTRGMGDLSSEGEEQSGATHTLFRGIRIRPEDLQEMAGQEAGCGK